MAPTASIEAGREPNTRTPKLSALVSSPACGHLTGPYSEVMTLGESFGERHQRNISSTSA
jgi:hypothetical protein